MNSPDFKAPKRVAETILHPPITFAPQPPFSITTLSGAYIGRNGFSIDIHVVDARGRSLIIFQGIGRVGVLRRRQIAHRWIAANERCWEASDPTRYHPPTAVRR